MTIRCPTKAESTPKELRDPYVLITRGRNGRSRLERFRDASSYSDRLATLRDAKPVSVDDLLDLLEA